MITMTIRFITACCLAFLFAGQFTSADDVDLQVGDAAPHFKTVDQDGKAWDSDDVIGKKTLVVYFYPAAMTPGCTKQACAFRDDSTKLKDANTEVVGISGDTAENLKLFEKAHQLNFRLLADPDGAIAKAFGVPLRDGGEIQREVDGVQHTLKRGVTASRWTFVIGLDGKIAVKNTKVDAPNDSQTVLEWLSKKQ